MIELRNSFWKGPQFVYGKGEPERVLSYWFGLTPQFEQVMGLHPEALHEAKRATRFQTLGFVGGTVSAVGAGLYSASVTRDSYALDGSESDATVPLGLFVGGAIVAGVGNYLARSQVGKGIRIFNERQAASGGRLDGEVDLQEAGAARVSEEEGPSRQRPPGLESWYTYWGLGWSSPSYPDVLEPTIGSLRDTPGVSTLALNLDLLGFYFPVSGDKLVVGGILNAGAERFDGGGGSFQINQYTYSASAMYFVDQHIGRGFFVRGDAGLARIVLDSSFGVGASESGLGFLLGGGYAFPVTSGTRVLLNANYARRSIEGESYGMFNLSLGGLF